MRWKGVCGQALQATSLVLYLYHTCPDSSNAVLCFNLFTSLSIIPHLSQIVTLMALFKTCFPF